MLATEFIPLQGYFPVTYRVTLAGAGAGAGAGARAGAGAGAG